MGFFNHYGNRNYRKFEEPEVSPYDHVITRRRRKPLDEAYIKRLPQSDRFVAIDFEFMDETSSSVCQIGAVLVENGKVIKTFDSLVNPPTKQQGYYQFKAHRIPIEKVQNAPTWPEVWKEVDEMIGNSPVVCFNVPSAERKGIDACGEYFGTRTDYDYIDARDMAEIYFESKLTDVEPLRNYKLPVVCEALEVPMRHHHTAIEDAYATAQVFLKLRELGSEEIWSTPCR